MSINHIDSDSLIQIEQHFRVSAGPGSGKTHWLVNHIKNVLHHSDRLSKSRKIACITYTNVAVETIISRLGLLADQVDVTTIHSFLYKHIVKPYAFYIADEYSLDVQKMDLYNESTISFKRIKSWLENSPNKSKLVHPYTINQLCKLDSNKRALFKWLSSIKYKFNSFNILELQCDRTQAYDSPNGNQIFIKRKCLEILEKELLDYKKAYWIDGILHYEDVLFFSYQLIDKCPFILSVLRAKFPYFFIDEFQDTHPIQAKILERVGNQETIVGIIGDKAQSIYKFQGAEPAQFTSFDLPNIVDFSILVNRRSTSKIIDILNLIRPDFPQKKFKSEQGHIPLILVGKMDSALARAQYLCDAEVYSLSRNNITAGLMKRGLDDKSINYRIIEDLLEADSPTSKNGYRSRVIIACIKAVELAREKKFLEAIKELEFIFRDRIDKEKCRKEALKSIYLLLDSYNKYYNKFLYDFFSIIKKEIKTDISDLKIGIAKAFYDGNTYEDIALCIKIIDDTNIHRTIHKAKGDEFNNVLLVLKSEKDLSFLLSPHINDINEEEQRINYVAVSRAKERLFISVPSLLDTVSINSLSNYFLIEQL